MLIRRESRTGANDLNTIYRPCTVNEFLGNKTNVNMMRKSLDKGTLDHAILFTGPAGCGKTTAARIIALGLNCESTKVPTSTPCLECHSCRSILNQNDMDVLELNVGQSGGKDYVDSIARELPNSPFSSRFKVIIFDEAHKLTTASQALLLKIIEDGYRHVYFIFCTNEPEKLSEPFIQRVKRMKFSPLPKEFIFDLLKNVSEFEAMSYTTEVLQHITNESRGIPRVALGYLKQINDEGSWTIAAAQEVVSMVSGADDPQIIEICRALVKGSFKDAAKLYDGIKEKIQPESVRIAIVGYMTGCLLRSTTFPDGIKFSKALDALSPPIFEQGKLGDNKLINHMFKTVCMIQGKV
jgi:DNA polymerase III subunit gamma/tau